MHIGPELVNSSDIARKWLIKPEHMPLLDALDKEWDKLTKEYEALKAELEQVKDEVLAEAKKAVGEIWGEIYGHYGLNPKGVHHLDTSFREEGYIFVNTVDKCDECGNPDHDHSTPSAILKEEHWHFVDDMDAAHAHFKGIAERHVKEYNERLNELDNRRRESHTHRWAEIKKLYGLGEHGVYGLVDDYHEKFGLRFLVERKPQSAQQGGLEGLLNAIMNDIKNER